ncbi:MAG: hypothetical protein ACD_75C01545G0001 [uncultured bacterium]|nr:MAG: hypothetical protein ACD_75C01545G0001 [uncultured bacterium]
MFAERIDPCCHIQAKFRAEEITLPHRVEIGLDFFKLPEERCCFLVLAAFPQIADPAGKFIDFPGNFLILRMPLLIEQGDDFPRLQGLNAVGSDEEPFPLQAWQLGQHPLQCFVVFFRIGQDIDTAFELDGTGLDQLTPDFYPVVHWSRRDRIKKQQPFHFMSLFCHPRFLS